MHPPSGDEEDEENELWDEDSSSSDATTTASISSSISESRSSSSRHPSYSRSSSSASTSTPSSPFPISRKAFKNVLLISQTRRAITNRAWAELWQGLLAIEPILDHNHTDLGIFLPMFDRIWSDVEGLLQQHEKDREYRKQLSSSEAKALAVLAQKWTKMIADPRYRFVRESVKNVLKPVAIEPGAVDRPTAQLLAIIESILVLGSPRKISLARMGLKHVPRALVDLDEVVRWYVSFESSPIAPGRIEGVLSSIKILDLSRNQLTTLPDSLPHVLSRLECLNLAHNAFVALPTTLTQFRHLDRLGIKETTRRRKGNVRISWAAILQAGGAEGTITQDQLPSLAVLCIRVIQRSLESLGAGVRALASHVRLAVEIGYDCESCGRFVPPPKWLAPIYERVRLLSPAVSLPQPAEDGCDRRGTRRTEVLNVLGASAVSPYGLSFAERLAVAVGSQGRQSVGVVVGPRRLCERCGWLHLSFEPSGGAELMPDQGECKCAGCVEERTAVGQLGVVRWVRKKIPRRPSP